MHFLNFYSVKCLIEYFLTTRNSGSSQCKSSELSYLQDILQYPVYETLTWFSNQPLQCLFSFWSESNGDLALQSVKQADTGNKDLSMFVPQSTMLQYHVSALPTVYTNHFHSLSSHFQKLLLMLCFLEITNKVFILIRDTGSAIQDMTSQICTSYFISLLVKKKK